MMFCSGLTAANCHSVSRDRRETWILLIYSTLGNTLNKKTIHGAVPEAEKKLGTGTHRRCGEMERHAAAAAAAAARGWEKGTVSCETSPDERPRRIEVSLVGVESQTEDPSA